MPLVAGDDVRERTNADVVAVGGAAPRPGDVGEVSEEREVRASDGLELRYEIAQRQSVELGCPSVGILVKTRQLSRVAAGEPKRAIAEDPFRIGKVSNDLLHAPCVRRVAQARLSLRDAAEEGERLRKIRFHRREDVVLGDERYIIRVVRCVLRWIWPGHC